ncbi:MAG: SH3 domain-containing protein [candidate division Zixibacteria bacterium]|nr:SH3 domain-containing protein [candidate division Zixibacteria bacterium]
MTHKKTCRVIKAYRSAYPDPLIIKAGEVLTIENRESEWAGWTRCINKNGKDGWIPDSCLETRGNKATALRDYDATELTVDHGEELIVVNKEAGWFWCENQDGQTGWVPGECLEMIE